MIRFKISLEIDQTFDFTSVDPYSQGEKLARDIQQYVNTIPGTYCVDEFGATQVEILKSREREDETEANR